MAFGVGECLDSRLWDFFFMAVMRLHHGKHEYMKRARSQSMP
jgi:hypothetical protein